MLQTDGRSKFHSPDLAVLSGNIDPTAGSAAKKPFNGCPLLQQTVRSVRREIYSTWPGIRFAIAQGRVENPTNCLLRRQAMKVESTLPVSNRVGILVGGGPAPGINGTIGAVTLEASNRGCQIVGVYEGFSHLMAGRTDRVK